MTYHFLYELQADEVPASLNVNTGQVRQLLDKSPILKKVESGRILTLKTRIKTKKYLDLTIAEGLAIDPEYIKWYASTYKGKVSVEVTNVLNTKIKELYLQRTLNRKTI